MYWKGTRILGCQRCGGKVDRQNEMSGHCHGYVRDAVSESTNRGVRVAVGVLGEWTTRLMYSFYPVVVGQFYSPNSIMYMFLFLKSLTKL